MTKSIIAVLLFIGTTTSNAQIKQDSLTENTTKKSKDHHLVKQDSAGQKYWKISGSNSLAINQSSFSNWMAGGNNNLTVDIRLNYDFNHQKNNWIFDNKFLLNYGFNKQKSSSLKKTDDRIEITSILGRKINKVWNYSAYFNFKTQLDKGLDPKDPKNKISHFFSPIFIQAGPGILWKKNDNFKINFSPVAPRFIFVHSEFTKNGKSYGVSRDKVMHFEFGSSLYTYYKFKIMENVNFENIFTAYANYLSNTKGIDFNYQGAISMRINKYLSANLYYEALYDLESLEMLQQKESIGVGFKHSF